MTDQAPVMHVHVKCLWLLLFLTCTCACFALRAQIVNDTSNGTREKGNYLQRSHLLTPIERDQYECPVHSTPARTCEPRCDTHATHLAGRACATETRTPAPHTTGPMKPRAGSRGPHCSYMRLYVRLYKHLVLCMYKRPYMHLYMHSAWLVVRTCMTMHSIRVRACNLTDSCNEHRNKACSV